MWSIALWSGCEGKSASTPTRHNPSSGARVSGRIRHEKPIALLVPSGAPIVAEPALARDIHLQKMGASALKQICAKIGGSFTQGSKRYACGTDCIVSCLRVRAASPR